MAAYLINCQQRIIRDRLFGLQHLVDTRAPLSTNYFSLTAGRNPVAETGLDMIVDGHQFERSQPVIGMRPSQDDLFMDVKKEQRPEANARVQDISGAKDA